MFFGEDEWNEIAARFELAKRSPELLVELDKREFKRIVDEEDAARQAGADDLKPVMGLLSELDATLPPAEPARIEGLLSAGGNALVVAQRKIGKTSLCLSLVRSLTLGTPFLGRFPVQVAGRVAYLNAELDPAEFSSWVRAAGIPSDRLFVVHSRGNRNPLVTQASRVELAQALRAAGCEVLVVDPFTALFTGESENDSAQVGAWLARVSQVAKMAHISEVVVAAHSGKAGKGALGSVRLEGWPDTVMLLTTEGGQPQGRRWFAAYGRTFNGTSFEDEWLDYDPASRTLTLSGDKVDDTTASGGVKGTVTPGRPPVIPDKILAVLKANGSMTVADLCRAIPEHSDRGIRDALRKQLEDADVYGDRGQQVAMKTVITLDEPLPFN